MYKKLAILATALYPFLFAGATIMKQSFPIMTAAAISGVIAAILSVLVGVRSVDRAGLTRTIATIVMLIIPIIASVMLMSVKPISSDLIVALSFIVAIVTTAVIGVHQTREMHIRAMQLLAIGFALLTTAFAVSGKTSTHGRLAGFDGELHPNYIGLIALVSGSLGFLLPMRLSLVMLLINTWVIMLCSSRASLVSLILCGIVYSVVLRFRSGRLTSISAMDCIKSLAAVATVGVVFWYYKGGLAKFFFEDVLAVNDPNRGISSGATGRTIIWDTLYRAWQRSPWFGNGYGVFSRNLGGPLDGGYFLTLAETGVVGLASIILMCFSSIYSVIAWRSRSSRWDVAECAFLIGFLFYNLFESRLQGGANPFSICAYLVCFSLLSRPWDGGDRTLDVRYIIE